MPQKPTWKQKGFYRKRSTRGMNFLQDTMDFIGFNKLMVVVSSLSIIYLRRFEIIISPFALNIKI